MLKPSIIDRIVGWYDPAAGLRRAQSRTAQDLLLRGYDGAKSYPTSDWTGNQNTSANNEIQAAQSHLRWKSRDLGRNNPYAVRALNVIVSNVVGAGITANIKGKNKTQVKRLTELWKQVAESSLCDDDGRNNFCALQALAMRAIVESGEVIAIKKITPEAPKMKLLESDYIVSKMNTGNIVQGIEVDDQGRRLKYFLYKRHPGDQFSTLETFDIPADRLAHAYRQDRPGQLRGVAWSHAVIETLKDFADYQYATIVRQKIAACYGGFITTNDSTSLLSSSELKSRREAEMQLSPGMVRYLKDGESFQNANPPGVEGYGEFIRESMRSVAAGYGISAEALTGDYSQVNFSSGRMGHMEFRRNIDNWRWNMLIPQFCDPYFQWFLEWASAVGVDTDGASVQWDPPAYTMIDPVKEVTADKEAVAAGFKSRSQVIRESGNDPSSVLAEIVDERAAAKVSGIVFDTDVPQGMQQQSDGQGNSNSDQANKTEAP